MGPFAHQVAGHPSSIQTLDASGATLIKPSSSKELNFYTHLGPSLSLVGEWTPEFFGTLTLEGKMDENGQVEKKVEGVGMQMLVLENVTFRFVRPNVLDVKLGKQLWDEDSSVEKRERMDKVSRETTSGSTGMRLTGFQVWDKDSQSYTVTPKTYGKSISPSDLPTGISKFFLPLITSQSPLLPHLLRAILRRLAQLIQVWEELECRMRGGSVLIVVEGDEERLEEAMRREYLLPPTDSTASASSDPPQPPSVTSPTRKDELRDQSHVQDNDDEEEAEEEGEADSDEDSDEESIASSTDSNGCPLPSSLKPFELRLIDFAHFSEHPGEGLDEDVLLGLKTVEGLLRGLLEKCEKEFESKSA